MLGDAWVDRSLQNRNEFNTEFQEMITRHVWGDIWTRPGIDTKTRRFMVLSIMIALGSWEEFRLHVRSGLAAGDLSKDDLKEIILQATAYCGAPAGNHAMHQADIAFKEMAR
jgi:alkylhydroperoxidase/carboxymuconolactone decarboxylase family protein YurZ